MSAAGQATSGEAVQSLGDIQRIEATPLAQRNLPETVDAAIAAGAQIAAGKPALIFVPDATAPQRFNTFSYAQLLNRIRQAASVFSGLVPTPTVSLLLPNLPETHFALWGAQMAGRANPINPMLEVDKIAEIIRAADARIVVTLQADERPGLFEKAVAAASMAGGVRFILTVDPAAHGASHDGGDASSSRAPEASGDGEVVIASFHSLLDDADARRPTQRAASDVGALFHTGGTTGAPKIAQLTHGGQVFIAWAAALNPLMQQADSLFCGLPLFHVNAALVTGLTCWMGGKTVVLGPPQGYRAPGVIAGYWRLVETFRIGGMSAVPTIYRALLDVPVGDHDIGSLRFGICGAAPISAASIQAFEDQVGVQLLEGYGLTEGTCISTINPGYAGRGQAGSKAGSVGLRLPYQDLKILIRNDSGAYEQAPTGTPGSVCIHGPNVFAGYLKDADNSGIWVEHGGRRYYDSGDLGSLDADGFLWLSGRKKELIIRGGHNIDPAMIEDALSRHPQVELVAAVGAPDARVGELPVAFVTRVPGATVTEAELIEYVSQHVAERAAVPKRIDVIDAMPLTAVGKIYKPELRRRACETAFQDVVDACLGAGRATVSVSLQQGGRVGARVRLEPTRTQSTDVQRVDTLLSVFPVDRDVARY